MSVGRNIRYRKRSRHTGMTKKAENYKIDKKVLYRAMVACDLEQLRIISKLSPELFMKHFDDLTLYSLKTHSTLDLFNFLNKFYVKKRTINMVCTVAFEFNNLPLMKNIIHRTSLGDVALYIFIKLGLNITEDLLNDHCYGRTVIDSNMHWYIATIADGRFHQIIELYENGVYSLRPRHHNEVIRLLILECVNSENKNTYDRIGAAIDWHINTYGKVDSDYVFSDTSFLDIFYSAGDIKWLKYLIGLGFDINVYNIGARKYIEDMRVLTLIIENCQLGKLYNMHQYGNDDISLRDTAYSFIYTSLPIRMFRTIYEGLKCPKATIYGQLLELINNRDILRIKNLYYFDIDINVDFLLIALMECTYTLDIELFDILYDKYRHTLKDASTIAQKINEYALVYMREKMSIVIISYNRAIIKQRQIIQQQSQHPITQINECERITIIMLKRLVSIGFYSDDIIQDTIYDIMPITSVNRTSHFESKINILGSKSVTRGVSIKGPERLSDVTIITVTADSQEE